MRESYFPLIPLRQLLKCKRLHEAHVCANRRHAVRFLGRCTDAWIAVLRVACEDGNDVCVRGGREEQGGEKRDDVDAGVV